MNSNQCFSLKTPSFLLHVYRLICDKEIAGIKISTAKSEVLHLAKNLDQCVLQVNRETQNQVEKFKYLGVASMSDGR